MFIMVIKSVKREKVKAEQMQPIDTTNDFEVIEFNAKVIDLACTTRMVGIKYPKSIEEYFVCFQKEDDKKMRFSISKEFYDGFEIGQVGKLKLIDGEIYSFIPF